MFKYDCKYLGIMASLNKTTKITMNNLRVSNWSEDNLEFEKFYVKTQNSLLKVDRIFILPETTMRNKHVNEP